MLHSKTLLVTVVIFALAGVQGRNLKGDKGDRKLAKPNLTEYAGRYLPNTADGELQEAHSRLLASHVAAEQCSFAPHGQPVPKCSAVPLTHAHNDYEHPFPLFEALSWGFVSAEADIFLYEGDEGNLRVAHDPVDDPTTLPVLQELYLDPLAAQFHYHDNGGIYADGTRFHLLVDIKNNGEATYTRLHEILASYAIAHPGFLTTYRKLGDNEWEVIEGAVDITISGDRPRDLMIAQELRYSSYDGRRSDIGEGASPAFIHLLSDNWNRFFGDYGWDGSGEMPVEIKIAVSEIVETVHNEGRLIRFWNLPNDDWNVWGPLIDAGVDYINTDRLGPLSEFAQRSCAYAPFGYPIPSCNALPYTHAHNDYEHPFPLYDALSWGFISAESDIFLYENDGGNLRVAHDPVEDPKTLSTIEQLYLDPLLNQFHFHDNGGVYADGTGLHLLVDIKTEGESTYTRLHEVLGGYAGAYPGFIATYIKIGENEWTKIDGAIEITISGNRPRELMLDQTTRYATYDGRMADIGSDISPHFLHLLSDNWNRFFGDFGWDGQGEMPDPVKEAVASVVDQVQGEGRKIRFWNLPNDDANVWGPLIEAGIDFVNTDRLGPLSLYVDGNVASSSDC